jgi:hypothetical protein
MSDLGHVTLDKEPDELPAGGPRPSRAPWLLVLLLAGLVGAGIFIWRNGWWWGDVPQPEQGRPETTVAVEPQEGQATIVLPDLNGSDPYLRQLARDLGPHPLLLAWLAGQDLARQFAATVDNVADGRSPARHLRSLAPVDAFRVVERGGGTYVDPGSYARYDAAADAFASLDTARCAKVYQTVKPLLASGIRELGHGEADVDAALTRAFRVLLATPVPDTEPRLEARGLVYGFADPALEDLLPAQKHLLRMGPRNARLVQRKLRELSQALGLTVTPANGVSS